jgi:predicted AAA+ superfamily ATPase
MIERQLKNRILSVMEFFPAVAILGPRQSGKTTLAKMVMKNLSRESYYLDLENPLDLARLTDPLAFFRANMEKCIIIDEIQRNPELFPILRSVVDEDRQPGRFILLGSASPELIFLSSESLTGRIVYMELTPFIYCEVKQIKHEHDHWMRGGYPQPFLNDKNEFRKEWFKSFFMTYIERDLRLLGLNANTQNLSRFFFMLAHQSGSILNKSSLSKSLEQNLATITNYLNYFEKAYLVRVLQPWHQNIKKRLVKSPKVYIRDTGLLHYLLGINDFNSLLGNPVIGHSWEGYVIEQIVGCLGDDYRYYYYRTQDGTECDLLITKGIHPICCIEAKFTSSPKMTRSFTTCISDLETRDNFIIIPTCPQSFNLSPNISVCDLENFFSEIKKANA